MRQSLGFRLATREVPMPKTPPPGTLLSLLPQRAGQQRRRAAEDRAGAAASTLFIGLIISTSWGESQWTPFLVLAHVGKQQGGAGELAPQEWLLMS